MKHLNPRDRLAWALLCIFVFAVPFEKTIQLAGVGTAAKAIGLAAFAAAVPRLLRRRPRPPNLALALAALFVAWSALTWTWSLAPAATAARAATFAQLLAMTWLVWELCRTQRQQAQLLAAYVAGAAVASLATLTRYAQGRQTYYRRYAAAGFDPNDLGLTVALAIPFALYLALRARGPARYACWLAVALVEAAVLLSGSRTALVVCIIGFAFAALTVRQADPPARIAAAVLVAVLALGLVWLAPAASRRRLATLPHELARGSLHNRTAIWKAGLKAFKHRPIRGVGAGAYPAAVEPRLGRPAIPGHEYVAHNAFLSVLVEQGAVGFAIFAALLAVLAVFAWVMPDCERALWLILLAAWTAGVFTLTWEHRKPAWLLFALIMTAWARSFREESA